ncbi:MAG: hypothetical protein AAF721_38765, partial [Myxococcota bacterium]
RVAAPTADPFEEAPEDASDGLDGKPDAPDDEPAESTAVCLDAGGVCLAGDGCPAGYRAGPSACQDSSVCCQQAACTSVPSGRCLPDDVFERSGGCGQGLVPGEFLGCTDDAVCCVPGDSV